jgi:acetolactate synthase-1/2/3 large subunit
LAAGHEDVAGALQALMTELNAGSAAPDRYETAVFDVPTGKISTRGVATLIAQKMPEGSILCGDSGGGAAVLQPAQQSKAHTWLNLTGGSIGQGGPAAVGAAIAAPNTQVFALLGDGASMYTIQALWTQARERLAVITVIFNNQRYGILETEYLRLGVNEIGQHAGALFDLSEPSIHFADLASSLGVVGHRVDTCEAFQTVLDEALQRVGPTLIEVML